MEKLIEIRKNEHFGDVLMFLDIKSPLLAKVKSKKADLFLLNVKWNDIVKRFTFYGNITVAADGAGEGAPNIDSVFADDDDFAGAEDDFE